MASYAIFDAKVAKMTEVWNPPTFFWLKYRYGMEKFTFEYIAR
jgi:hypothetical protein